MKWISKTNKNICIYNIGLMWKEGSQITCQNQV